MKNLKIDNVIDFIKNEKIIIKASSNIDHDANPVLYVSYKMFEKIRKIYGVTSDVICEELDGDMS